MGFLKELFAKQRYPVFLLLVGLSLIFFANYSMSGELSKLQVAKESRANVPLLGIGLLCIATSMLLFLVDEDSVAFSRGCKIRSTSSGFETTFRDRKICVDFGRLEELYPAGDRSSVAVLPANEFFDDRCFNDERTTAGSFIRRYFNIQQASSLKNLVEQKLTSHPGELVDKGQGVREKSYGVGTCVYLELPLGTPHRMILASVATDRDQQGLRTELSAIFKVIEQVRCTVANARLSLVYVPLLGAGKGGVPPEVAFLTLVSAILEARCREGGHHLNEVHVVIYQPEGKDPQVARRRAKSGLRQLTTLYKEVSK